MLIYFELIIQKTRREKLTKNEDITAIIEEAKTARNNFKTAVKKLKELCAKECDKVNMTEEKKKALWLFITDEIAFHFDEELFQIIFHKHQKLIEIFS